MACTTYLTGFSTSCGSNLPSIKKLYIGAFESASFTYTYQQDGDGQDVLDVDGNQIIESVSGATLNSGAEKFVEFQFRKNSSSMDTEMTVNDNGSHFYTNTANLVFAKIDNTKRLALEATASGECTMIIVDSNNQTWLVGGENPVSLTTLSGSTGTAVGDSNQYTVALSSQESHMPLLVEKEQTETILNTLLGIGA
jgi:hypothetical protein